MFTKEEVLDYIGPIKTKTLDELHTPEVPTIKFPNWLHPEIQHCLQEHLNILNKEKSNLFRVYNDHYPHAIRYLNRIIPAFTASEMKDFWQRLCEHSIPKTIEFTTNLLTFENNFEAAVNRKDNRFKRELHLEKNVFQACGDLLYAINEAQLHGVDLCSVEDFDLICHYLPLVKDRLIVHHRLSQKEIRTLPFDAETYPITRKYKEENSLAISFIRSIYEFFVSNFSKPMYQEISLFSQVIFKTTYTENEIIKLTRVVNESLDYSPPK